MRPSDYLLAAGILFGLIPRLEAAPKRAAARAMAGQELRQLCEANFQRWDRNHDGTLGRDELNALIESPGVRGDEAAAVVVIRQHFAPKGDKSDFRGLSRVQLLAFAEEREAARSFAKTRNRIRSINRALFLAGDPNLVTFHQGGVGDCYLLSVIGALVNRDPGAVRQLIAPLPGGAYAVRFAAGRVVDVPPLTDAELVMGAREGSHHGIWLSVLEKAYAAVREQNREPQGGAVPDEDAVVAKDLLGGGRAGPVIALFTGHKAAGAPVGRRATLDVAQAAERLHELLTRLSRERRLMAAGTGKNADKPLPKHLPHGHVCGVLGYDPVRRIVRVFNPWGNDFVPAGPPGRINGYATRNGTFEVPILDFVKIFGGLAYETDQPLTK
jgi:hypothetical protein